MEILNFDVICLIKYDIFRFISIFFWFEINLGFLISVVLILISLLSGYVGILM